MVIAMMIAMLMIVSPASAQLMARPTVIENVRIHTMDGDVIDNGTIIIRGRRIAEVGTDLSIPARAIRIDGSGLSATPGLIDLSSSLGMPGAGSGGNDPTGLALDAFDRYDTRAIAGALQYGVTTVAVGPNGHSGFGPAMSVIRLVPDGVQFGEVLADRIALSLNLRSDAGPMQRLQLVDNIRRQLRGAVQYEDALELYAEKLKEYVEQVEKDSDSDASLTHESADSDLQQPPRRRPQRQQQQSQQEEEEEEEEEDAKPEKPDRPTPNRRNDVLLEAMAQQLPVIVRAQRHEDILNALEIAEEFGLRIIIEGGAEAHLLAATLAAAKIPVILDPPHDSLLPRSGSQVRQSPAGAAALERAGVHWSIGSGRASGGHSRHVLATSQLIVQSTGLALDPLELITKRAAHVLGMADRIGAISNGLQADIVLWTGDPSDPATEVDRVLIGGTTVYERGADSEDDA